MDDKEQRPNLYLAGFMGTGKSTIGKILAQRWKWQLVDSDAAIEEAAQQPISEIFKNHGESYFRDLERKFIESGHPKHNTIISLGGGLICQEGMVDRIESLGVLITLFAQAQTVYERTKRHTHRPLLNVENPLAEIENLFAKREPFYRKASIHIMTDGRTLNEVADHVERSYGANAK